MTPNDRRLIYRRMAGSKSTGSVQCGASAASRWRYSLPRLHSAVSCWLLWLILPLSSGAQQSAVPAAPPAVEVPGKFVDITAASGVHFAHQAPHTSRKYLIETMGPGVALFDCDGDGRLDIFLVNGAPFSDPTPRVRFRKRPAQSIGIACFTRTPTGTFEDITEKAGVQGAGYGMGVAVG